MPIARANLTRPLPRSTPRRPRRPVLIEGGPGASIPQVIYPWNFSVRVWIAFDGPTVPLPTWIEVTGFIEHENPITIVHGRTDGIADVNAATLSLTADNSDGRWAEANPNGAWFGLIHKGCWIKVDVIPPSGIISTRFVGFTTDLPTGWTGQYASSLITASDRFEKLQRAKAIFSQIQAEVLTDPGLSGGRVKAYYNLHEASSSVYGQISFGDTSGNLARPLVASSLGGVRLGTGLGIGNANAPGFDGLKSVTFNPASTTQGTYLAGPITMPAENFDPVNLVFNGLYGILEFWFQATTTATVQYLASIVDPVAQFATSLWVGTDGQLNISTVPTAAANTAASSTFEFNNNFLYPRVDDGNWHHIALIVQSTSAAGGWTIYGIIQDGRTPGGTFLASGASGDNLSQLIIGGGYTASRALSLGAGNFSDVAWTWAWNSLNTTPALPVNPNYIAHAAAGLTGFLGESTDQRVARVARYAGVPIPLTAASWVAGNTLGTVNVYSPGTGPWTSLSVGAHPCGTQSMSGRKPLDVMQEAARTEGMPLYVDRNGYLALQPSTIRQNTSPAWTVDARDLDPSTSQVNNFTYLTNQMTVTPNSQAAQTVIGPAGQASQAKYGEYDGSQATANLTPLEAQSLGLGVIALRADPPPRLSPIVVEVATLATQAGYGAAWYDAVLATAISTPIRVTNMPAAVGGGNADAYVEGWQETLTSGNHAFSFSTSPLQGATYQLDSPSLGLIDTAGITLAY